MATKLKLIETISPDRLAAYVVAGVNTGDWSETTRLAKAAVPAKFSTIDDNAITFSTPNGPNKKQLIITKKRVMQLVVSDGNGMSVHNNVTPDDLAQVFQAVLAVVSPEKAAVQATKPGSAVVQAEAVAAAAGV